MPKPVRAWAIIDKNGDYSGTRNGVPELFTTAWLASSQNIDKLNGSRVIRVEIRHVKPKKKA